MSCFSARAHQDDYVSRIWCAVVVKQVIIASGQLSEPIHLRLNDARNRRIIWIDCLTRLEVNVRVLGRAAQHRTIR